MTANLMERARRAAEQVEVPWSEARAAEILRGVHTRRRRQRRRRAVGAATLVLALAALAPQLLSRAPRTAATSKAPLHPPAPLLAAEMTPAELPPVRLRDGSVARPQRKTSQVRVREESPARTVVELAGAARFEVVHDPQRLFRVETRGLAVEVLGTQFVVDEQDSQVRVTVQQGRVRVLWASHYEELGAGQSGVFPREQAAEPSLSVGLSLPPLREPPPVSVRGVPALTDSSTTSARGSIRRGPVRSERPAPPPAPETTPTVAAVAAPPVAEPPSWQALAHEGQFEQAYRIAYGPQAETAAPHRAGEPALLRDHEVVPGDLLLLADVARLSHHAADAVAPLSRLLREHAADPRAPLAAFTLGRVLLDDLGRPREAAQSFERAQQLDPAGPLSQDALAREVEAWSRAGEAASAHARALQYVQKYPAGRRLRSVRHFGELL